MGVPSISMVKGAGRESIAFVEYTRNETNTRQKIPKAQSRLRRPFVSAGIRGVLWLECCRGAEALPRALVVGNNGTSPQRAIRRQ